MKVKERLEFLSLFQVWRNDNLVDRKNRDGEDSVDLCLLVKTPGEQDLGDEECLRVCEHAVTSCCTLGLLKKGFATAVDTAGTHPHIWLHSSPSPLGHRDGMPVGTGWYQQSAAEKGLAVALGVQVRTGLMVGKWWVEILDAKRADGYWYGSRLTMR